jgi:hypothetical protein
MPTRPTGRTIRSSFSLGRSSWQDRAFEHLTEECAYPLFMDMRYGRYDLPVLHSRGIVLADDLCLSPSSTSPDSSRRRARSRLHFWHPAREAKRGYLDEHFHPGSANIGVNVRGLPFKR